MDDIRSRTAKLLGQIDPRQPLGTELFDSIAKLSVSVAIETVSFRIENGKIEVYLTQRSPIDTAYPNQWHCPGSFIRPGEEISDVLQRLEKKETGIIFKGANHIATVNNPAETRGHIVQLIHLCEICGQGRGKWFPLDQLPKNIVEQHRIIIQKALAYFEDKQIYFP